MSKDSMSPGLSADTPQSELISDAAKTGLARDIGSHLPVEDAVYQETTPLLSVEELETTPPPPARAIIDALTATTIKRRHTADAPSRPPLTAENRPARSDIRRRDSVTASMSGSSTHERRSERNHRKRPTRSRRSSTYGSAPYAYTYNSSRPTSSRISTGRTLPVLNIDEAIALHKRSCSLFQNAAYTASTPTIPRHCQQSRPESPGADMMPLSTLSAETLTRPTTPRSSEPEPDQYTEPDPLPPAHAATFPTTTTYWTSSTTRLNQYAEIDRWGRGLRGLWRRIAPRWCFRKAMVRFYEEKGCGTDAGSVRRYRIDVEDESTDQKAEVVREKGRKEVERERPEKRRVVKWNGGAMIEVEEEWDEKGELTKREKEQEKGASVFGIKRPRFGKSASCF